MDWIRYENSKAYAGELKASMLRRRIGHDYTSRRIYLITMTVEGRRPLLGKLVGNVRADKYDKDGPRVELSELGRAVCREWDGIKNYYPEVQPLALQIMPDHLHGILFVTRKMEKHLGTVVKGFKTGTNRLYRQIVLGPGEETAGGTATAGETATAGGGEAADAARWNAAPVEADVPVAAGDGGKRLVVDCVATVSQLAKVSLQPLTPCTSGTKRDRSLDNRHNGMLWSLGYNDHILSGDGELNRWIDYLVDNPRRLALRRAFPDYFRVQFGLEVGGRTYTAIGNRFLLAHPSKVQVQLSRSLTDAQIEERVAHFLGIARSGSVLVSPAISKGEQRVMRAALDAGMPIVFITPWGVNSFSKPGHAYYEACCEGRFLILAPWPHQNRRIPLTRQMCLAMNAMTEAICSL